jgi:hypothetical protein
MLRPRPYHLSLAFLLAAAAMAPTATAQPAGGYRVVDIEVLATRKENEIKLSEKNRPIDVTVLGSVNFDVRDIDKATIQIEGVMPTSVNGRAVDYNNDTLRDYEYRIAVGKLKLDESTRTICLTGALLDGTKFRGCGPIVVKP